MHDFGPNDLDLATTFYAGVTDPTAKALLDFLIDHPDQRFDGTALVGHLNLPEHRAVARATYEMGQIAARFDRKRPWSEAQQGYMMPAARADLFRQARAASPRNL